MNKELLKDNNQELFLKNLFDLPKEFHSHGIRNKEYYIGSFRIIDNGTDGVQVIKAGITLGEFKKKLVEPHIKRRVEAERTKMIKEVLDWGSDQ